MGRHDLEFNRDPESIRHFTRAVLDDLVVLEHLLEEGHIETGHRRMGVEQEIFLVDTHGHPAAVAPDILPRLTDPRFTTELARFNLEANLAPKKLEGRFLRETEHELRSIFALVRETTHPRAEPLLVGILPTLRPSSLTLDCMTPDARYYGLNDAIRELRDGAFPVHIRGPDVLDMTHDNVMLEAANTSLQLHLQVDPAEFATLYNLVQLISAPLLAVSVNSPVLLGRRLWHETRVALFEQAVDGRSRAELDRGQAARVFFGRNWLESSVLEIFRESSSRFSALFGPNLPGARWENIDGVLPELEALSFHNGTVWRWNRACYGSNGKTAHLRIENRVLPAGPTIIDEVANAALFYGLMVGLPKVYGDVRTQMKFDVAKANFLAAARVGLDATFSWLGGRRVSAQDLISGELIQHARAGLRELEVPKEDVERYLSIIERRASSGQTGSRWALDSLSNLDGHGTALQRMETLTNTMVENQKDGRPVHRWDLIPMPTAQVAVPKPVVKTVGEIMSTDLFTIRPEEILDLALNVMQWQHIRHVPVEDREGRLVGLVSQIELLEAFSKGRHLESALPISKIMKTRLATVEPDCTIRDAMKRLLDTDTHCLLVTHHGRLAGIVTERDLIRVAHELLPNAGSPSPS